MWSYAGFDSTANLSWRKTRSSYKVESLKKWKDVLFWPYSCLISFWHSKLPRPAENTFSCKFFGKTLWCQGKKIQCPKNRLDLTIFHKYQLWQSRVYVPHPPSQTGESSHNSLWENISASFQKYILAMRVSMLLCSVSKSFWPGQGYENICKGINLTKINIKKFNILKPAVFGWCLFLITCLTGNFQRLLYAEIRG